MPFKNKLAVTVAFSCRLPIIPVAILRFVSLNSNSRSTDYTWDVVLAIALAQVEMHFSLIAATVPCLRPFLKALDTGYLATQAGQVDRSIVDPATESSYALRSKSSTNDPGSKRNSFSNRNSYRNSYRNSFQTRTSTGPFVPSINSHTIEDDEISNPPPPLPRKWKLPEELPVLDPYSSPAITSIHHPRQFRVGASESERELRRSVSPAETPSQDGDEVVVNNQGTEKWVIHKTVGYAVTRSASVVSGPERVLD
jgi:hypothetical protein